MVKCKDIIKCQAEHEVNSIKCDRKNSEITSRN